MKILYDYQAFDIQRTGGVSNVFAMLTEEAKKRAEIGIGFASTENAYMLKLGYPSREYTLHRLINEGKINPDLKVSDVDWKEVNQIASKNAIQRNDYDVFHPTHYRPYFLNYI